MNVMAVPCGPHDRIVGARTRTPRRHCGRVVTAKRHSHVAACRLARVRWPPPADGLVRVGARLACGGRGARARLEDAACGRMRAAIGIAYGVVVAVVVVSAGVVAGVFAGVVARGSGRPEGTTQGGGRAAGEARWRWAGCVAG